MKGRKRRGSVIDMKRERRGSVIDIKRERRGSVIDMKRRKGRRVLITKEKRRKGRGRPGINTKKGRGNSYRHIVCFFLSDKSSLAREKKATVISRMKRPSSVATPRSLKPLWASSRTLSEAEASKQS